MKLRLTVRQADGSTHDVEVSCDATATVGDAARVLLSTGIVNDEALARTGAGRLEPVTLCAIAGEAERPWLLDHATPLAASGIRSGWTVWPDLESRAEQHAQRMRACAGWAEVMSGRQQGVVFSLVAGENLIGRDPACRVHLLDPSVSRRHAALTLGPTASLCDLGSANGIALGDDTEPQKFSGGRIPIMGRTTVRVGDVTLVLTPGPPQPLAAHNAPGAGTADAARVFHTRPPRVAPRFTAVGRTLPAPPTAPPRGRVPTLALLTPMLMGAALYLVTRSPMSLMMMAFSPMLMVGSWLDGAVGTRRRRRADQRRFGRELANERTHLEQLRAQETESRHNATPTLARVVHAIDHGDDLLWARRPDDETALTVCLGEARLASDTRLTMPDLANLPEGQQRELQTIADEFAQVGPVPVPVSLRDAGALGVCGEGPWAASLTRSVLMQLAGLHTPQDLQIACVAAPERAPDWAWLRWLPHVAGPSSALSMWPLVADAEETRQLALELEAEADRRASAEGSRGPDYVVLVIACEPGAPGSAPFRADPETSAKLMALAEYGPERGIHLIWVAPHRTALPAACQVFAEVGAAEVTVSSARDGTSVQLLRPDFADTVRAERVARRLAPVEDAAARPADDTDVPGLVQLCDVADCDIVGGAGPIVRSWSASRSLMREWRAGAKQAPTPTATAVGLGSSGPIALDLRQHGPHALVGGTTGSGKSEFLQTWIMSLAATLSPDRCTFLLVDYKGGAAFAECMDLPHTVGVVTDLTPHLVRRSLTSLRAELHHREALLAARGAKDIQEMERRSDPATPPLLAIVIDEFAALAADHPEFVTGVVDVAQRGRSLGLHLVLATQRPAGVVTDAIRANTNLRIALRMADASDSIDVIGAADAAYFRFDSPGRAACVLGAGRPISFQTGYLGATPVHGSRSEIDVRSLGFGRGEPWPVKEPLLAPRTLSSAQASNAPLRSDIELVRDGIVAAAQAADITQPRRPWISPLPSLLSLAELPPVVEGGTQGGRQGSAAAETGIRGRTAPVVIGLRDQPALQRQEPFALALGDIGSFAVFGASGTGKTTTLITLACALGQAAVQRPVRVYAIDGAGGALGSICDLPFVVALAPISDLELVSRVLLALRAVVAERSERRSEAGQPQTSKPDVSGTVDDGACIVVMIDGFAAFRQVCELARMPPVLRGSTSASGDRAVAGPYELLQEIIRLGRGIGVHVVVTADRPAALPAAITTQIQQSLVLRLAQPQDGGVLGVPADLLSDAGPGRGVIVGGAAASAQTATASRHRPRDRYTEVQVAVPEQHGELRENALARCAEQYRSVRHTEAPRLMNAPTRVLQHELPACHHGAPVIGIDTRLLAPATIPTAGLAVVAGPSGSGVTTAAYGYAAAVARWARATGQPCETVVLDCGESTSLGDATAATAACDRRVSGEEEIAQVARELSRRIESERTPGQPLVCIVVERPADAREASTVAALSGLARAARRAPHLVVFEWESGAAANWELVTALKQPGWGLALQPDDAETQPLFSAPLGRISRADSPVGRGFIVSRGRVVPVQVAIPNLLE